MINRMEEKYLVSIIIPCYNVENYVAKAIDSCIMQTYKNLDIVVIDDGSKDSTSDVVGEYLKKDNRVAYYYKTNGGLSSARNEGLKYIKGEYVLFLDADDWLEPEAVETYVSMAQKDGKGCLVSAGMYGVVVKEDGTEKKKEYASSLSECILSKIDAIKNIGAGTMNLQSCCYRMYETAIIKEHGLKFNQSLSYSEDILFVFSYMQFIKKLHYKPVPVWDRLYREGSLSQTFYTTGKIDGIRSVVNMINLKPEDLNITENVGKDGFSSNPEIRMSLVYTIAMRFGSIMTVAVIDGVKKNKADIIEMRKIMKPYSKEFLKAGHGFKINIAHRIDVSAPMWILKLVTNRVVSKKGRGLLNSDISVD